MNTVSCLRRFTVYKLSFVPSNVAIGQLLKFSYICLGGLVQVVFKGRGATLNVDESDIFKLHHYFWTISQSNPDEELETQNIVQYETP